MLAMVPDQHAVGSSTPLPVSLPHSLIGYTGGHCCESYRLRTLLRTREKSDVDQKVRGEYNFGLDRLTFVVAGADQVCVHDRADGLERARGEAAGSSHGLVHWPGQRRLP